MTTARGRVVRGALLAMLALVLVAFLTGWWLLAGSRARVDGQRTFIGLHAGVRIERDALGTVTIDGSQREDLSFALGYVHAQERFFAMDLMRRVPAGELAALVGPAALPLDLNHRRHRLRATAAAAYAQLPADQQHTLDRYRDGVNAGLADLSVRPWEYVLLGVRPAPWRSQDSLLVIAAMYLDLNGDGRNSRELRLGQLRSALPAPLADFLLAPDPDWEAPLTGQLSRRVPIPDAGVMNLRSAATAAPMGASELTAALAPAADAARPGSNSFAVAGALTGTGAGLLANDMHLALRVPNIWFRARLRYPDSTAPGGQRDVNGVTLPGTPAMVVGSNGQIAWGFTNSYGDWQDWVRIVRDPAHPGRYKVPDGWATIGVYDEHIQVKGRPDTLLQVETTRWGPLMARDSDGTPLALAWTGEQPAGYNLRLMQLERTVDASSALELAPQLGMPMQNLLVADSVGAVGWTLAGNRIPLRGSADPLRPSDWSQPGSGWHGWADATHYPRVFNPPGGRLWTANNRTVDGAALALLGNGGYDLGARAQQIRDDLGARAQFRPGDMLDIQLDDRALLLTPWAHLLQDTLADTKQPALIPLRRLTASWDGHASVDSVNYTLVRAFRIQVTTAVLAPFVARVKKSHRDFAWPGESSAEVAVWTLIHAQPPNLLAPQYRDWHALLIAAAAQVAQQLGTQPGGLAARRWGEINRTAIRHPLSAVLPGWLGHFLDMPDQPLPGDSSMPRVAAPGFGASERFDVAPGHEAQGILEMPGGQSDNPLSPYYGAGHDDWVHGRPTPLLPGLAQHTLTLAPAS